MQEAVEYRRVYENVICENRLIELSARITLIKVAHRERKRKFFMCFERILYVEGLITITNCIKVVFVLFMLTTRIV